MRASIVVATAVLLGACSAQPGPSDGGGGGGVGGGGGTTLTGPTIKVLPGTSIAFGPIPFEPGAAPPRTSARTLMVRNVGTDPSRNLTFANPAFGVSAIGANASLSELSVSFGAAFDETKGLAPGKDLLVLLVEVTPASLGRKEFELRLHSNDPEHPDVAVQITAEAVAVPPCSLTVSPAVSLDFGILGPTPRELPITLTNSDHGVQSECRLFDVGLTADSSPVFELVGGPIAARTLKPAETLTLTIRATGSSPAAPTPEKGTLQFSVDTAGSAPRQVALTGESLGACLTIAPTDLNFGTVQMSCSSATRVFAIYNTCALPVTVVSSSMISPAGEPAGGPNCPGASACPEFIAVSTVGIAPNTVLSPGAAPATPSIKYHPINYGTDNGAFLVKVDQGGRIVDYVVTLTANGDSMSDNTDVFKQEVQPKVDVLVVLDRSPSMATHQASVALNLGRLVDNLALANVDFQLAVTSSDLTADGGALVGDATNPKLLTRATPSLKSQFLQKVASIGSAGSESSQLLAAATAAITPPLSSSANAGFVRGDATLAVLSISDSDDQSPGPVSAWAAQWLTVKPNPSQFSFSAVGPLQANPPAGCGYDADGGSPRMAAVTALTYGLNEDVCDPNWEPASLTGNDWGHRTNFYLTATPDLTQGNTLTVKQDGVVLSPTATDGGTTWNYDVSANSVNFEPASIPPPGSTLTISYKVACIP